MSQYYMACLKALNENNKFKVIVIHWAINKEAPFEFDFPKQIDFYEKNSLTLSGLLEKVEKSSPALIVCSGWVDKDYLKVCKKFKKSIPVVLGMDNIWNGGIKQVLGQMVGKMILKNYFSNIWIPGQPQLSYAEKLGFNKEEIIFGIYSADYNHFNNLFRENADSKKKIFPHRFLYVGRYIETKGIALLIDAFKESRSELSGWELWCVGTGELRNRFTDEENIKHLGFIQPRELAQVIRQTGVFILPSEYEPWGVVVHEFAAAGFPLILSSKVGAASQFVDEGKNGFLFPHNNKNALISLLIAFSKKTDNELYTMAVHSNVMASAITPHTWAASLLKLTEGKAA